MEMKLFMKHWHFDPLMMILVIGIIYLYYLVTGFKELKYTGYFSLGIFLFFLAECSPIQEFGMRYFSAHMISHVVILLICGPLLVASLRVRNISPLHDKVFLLSSFLERHSWLAWMTGVGIMWFWHIPSVFDGAMNAMYSSFSLIPVLHGGSMLLAGMLFSWPILGPFKSARLQPLNGIVYLFTACISCSLLGLLITFAPLNTWHHYAGMNGAAQDQQAAGLIMWVPCCFVYLSGCLYLLYRWFAETDVPKKKLSLQQHTQIIDHE